MWLILYSLELHTDDINVTQESFDLKLNSTESHKKWYGRNYLFRLGEKISIGFRNVGIQIIRHYYIINKTNYKYISCNFCTEALCVCKEVKSMSSL